MSDSDPMIGRVLAGNIEIRRKIGAGGMGNVYEGYQAHLERAVAVKVMTPEHAANPVAAKYFLREARSASRLRHPNIIQIIDYGKEDDATLFMAMEYIPGQPLSRLIRDEFPLERARIVSILDQTLAALAEAHRKQLVHRDLKPDNLMVEEIDDDDFVKVLDFGIAQSRAPEKKAGPLTQQGAVVGTPQYMSPEQAAGDAVDTRSDLFSLGTILYELLTGKPPFTGDSMPELLVSVIRHNPPPPSSQRPDLAIDPALEAVCLRALKKNPDLRYQTAAQFRSALADAHEGGSQPKEGPSSAPAQFVFKRSRTRPRAEVESEVETEISWAQESSAPREGLGLDVDQLRGDLLGERVDVVAVVAHQRSHRRIDAEEMADLRGGIDEIFNEVAHKWGARIHSRQGSFVTLLFGVPTPKPDDPDRAGKAALELRDTLQRLVPEGTVFSFGIASGEVFCPSSELSRAAGAPLDDGLEAARIAGDDEVTVAGEALQGRLDALFRLGEPLAGGERPVLEVREDADVAVPVASSPATSELIGRDNEVALLLGALGGLNRGDGSSLVVLGEPGVGKSALLDELHRLALQREFAVFSARRRWQGAEAVRAIRMQWLAGIVRHRGHVLRDAETAFREVGVAREYARLMGAFVNGDVADVFGAHSGRGVDEETRVEVALRFGMKKLVCAIRQPVVLLLDDVVGLGGEIADFVSRWAKTCAESGVLMATGVRVRPEESTQPLPEQARRISLGPLEPDAARAFARVRLPSTIADEVIEQIADIGGGVPLHLEHLARYARAHPEMSTDELEGALAKSREVGALLKMRLFEQPKPAQNVIALLAALGDGTRGNVLLELASRDWEPERVLGQLHEAGLLEIEGGEENPRLFLRPPALRRTAYDRLSRRMRTRIHARAARYYDERVRDAGAGAEHEDLVALAHHREASGEPKQALDVLRRLADDALRTYDHDLARRYLRDSVRLLREHAPKSHDAIATYELRLLRCDVAIGRRADAIDRCRKLNRADDLSPLIEAEVRLEMAKLWLVDEDPALVEKIAARALSDLRTLHADDPDDVERTGLLITALQVASRVQEQQGNPTRAAEFALEAVELTERSGIDPKNNPWGPSLVWETLNQLGRIRIRMGETGAARKMFNLAMRVVEATGDARGEVAVRANLATLLTTDGDLDSAHENLTAALRIARHLSDPHAIARLQYNRGTLLQRQGRPGKAQQAFEASLQLAEELDWREGIAMNVQRLRAFQSSSRDEP